MLGAIHLTALPLGPDNVVPDPTQSVVGQGQTNRSELSRPAVRPSAMDENKSDWKATTYATTKLAINMVKESSDAFPPLKSVVGGLSAILNHCDVCPVLLYDATLDMSGCPSKQWPVAKPLNHWYLGSSNWHSRLARLFLRARSKRKRGEGPSNSNYASSKRHGQPDTNDPQETGRNPSRAHPTGTTRQHHTVPQQH